MPGPGTSPIIFMAFDRPEYFQQVLRSVADQQRVDLSRRAMWLFLDGAVNPWSRATRGDQANIDASRRLFEQIFPHGRVFDSPHNLGVALNFERAEKEAFEARDCDAAIFLEDDMVLSPHYIATIDGMIARALEDPRIGYVAAFGDHHLSLAEQQRAPAELQFLSINWAFGLTRTQWLRNQPFVEQYLALLRDIDYRKRDSHRIFDLYSSWGMDRAFSSQDRAKMIACCLTQAARINTRACLGSYIGKAGIHFTADQFDRGGYERTEMWTTGPVEVGPMSDLDHARVLHAQHRMMVAPPPPLSAFVPATFGRKGHTLRALRAGFHQPEGWGVWASQLRAEMVFRVDTAEWARGAVLELVACHALAPNRTQAEVTVLCDGMACGVVSVGATAEPVRVGVPPGLLRAGNNLRLTLLSSSLVRQSNGAQHGVGVASLRVVPA